jgi:hypothetical protein
LNAFNKIIANPVNFFHAALVVNSAPNHVMALVSALSPVATAVNSPNYAKLYHAAMVVNLNTYLDASLAVMMPFVIFVAVLRDVNFVIALMHVEISFNA